MQYGLFRRRRTPQKHFQHPVIGVIEPGAEEALRISKNKRIAVLATKGTIRSQAYQNHIKKLCPDAFVLPIECPLLAALVEEGMHLHPATRLILRDYLKPLKENPIDTILLGCTHYPLLKQLIQEEAGPDIQILDSAMTCADKIEKVLNEQNLRSTLDTIHPSRYFVSDNPEKFKILGESFLARPLVDVSLKTMQ